MMSLDSGSQHSFSDPFDRRVADRLRRIAETQRAPTALRDRVLADLASEQFSDRRRVRWDLFAAGAVGAMLSAAAAVVIWLAAPAASPTPDRDATPWFDIALNNVTGNASFETTQPASLREWFEAQVSHDVDVPAIPDADLQGGRLAYVDGIRGAAMEYRLNGMPLTYLMVPEDIMERFTQSSDSMSTWSVRGHRIVMWVQDGTTRALVAPMPQDDLIWIADHCRRTMI